MSAFISIGPKVTIDPGITVGMVKLEGQYAYSIEKDKKTTYIAVPACKNDKEAINLEAELVKNAIIESPQFINSSQVGKKLDKNI